MYSCCCRLRGAYQTNNNNPPRGEVAPLALCYPFAPFSPGKGDEDDHTLCPIQASLLTLP